MLCLILFIAAIAFVSGFQLLKCPAGRIGLAMMCDSKIASKATIMLKKKKIQEVNALKAEMATVTGAGMGKVKTETVVFPTHDQDFPPNSYLFSVVICKKGDRLNTLTFRVSYTALPHTNVLTTIDSLM